LVILAIAMAAAAVFFGKRHLAQNQEELDALAVVDESAKDMESANPRLSL
jgi:hypothetical protein